MFTCLHPLAMQMIGGYTLTSADYFHHLLFIPTLGRAHSPVFHSGGMWQGRSEEGAAVPEPPPGLQSRVRCRIHVRSNAYSLVVSGVESSIATSRFLLIHLPTPSHTRRVTR